MRTFDGRNLFGSSAGNDPATVRATFRPQVDNVVGALDDVDVVLNYDHCITHGDQSLQHVEQFVHVSEVKTGRRLVEYVDGSSGRAFGKFFGEFNSLSFATGKRRRRLTELDVAQPDIEQSLQLRFDLRNVFEQW